MCRTYFAGSLKALFATFSIDRRFLYTMLIDLAFVLLLIAGLQVLDSGMNSIIPEQYPLQAKLNNIDYMQRLELQELRETLSAAKARIIAYSLLFIVYLTLICTASRCMIYHLIERKKPFHEGWLRTYLKFIAINVILFIILFLAYVVFMTVLALLLSPAAPLGLGLRSLVFLVAAYFVFLLHYLLVSASFLFVRRPEVGSTVKSLFTILVRRMHIALLPVFFVLVMLILINIVVMLSQLLGTVVSVIVVTVLILFFLSFLRFYYVRVLDAFVLKQGAGHAPAAHAAGHDKAVGKRHAEAHPAGHARRHVAKKK